MDLFIRIRVVRIKIRYLVKFSSAIVSKKYPQILAGAMAVIDFVPDCKFVMVKFRKDVTLCLAMTARRVSEPKY